MDPSPGVQRLRAASFDLPLPQAVLAILSAPFAHSHLVIWILLPRPPKRGYNGDMPLSQDNLGIIFLKE